MPDPSHVGRRYEAPGQAIDASSTAAFAAAIAGIDQVFEPGAVPPTFAAVYCLYPCLGQLFGDEEVGINLAGLIHGEQSFEWLEPVRPGDRIDSSCEISSVEEKRGMTFVGIRYSAKRAADAAEVLRGTSTFIVRGG